ncbi:MAG: porin [Porticoccus sp.]|nr:porin [Porticoccus sp.]MBQ0806347.1 porin [Porticoccus sp.]
MNKTKLLKNLLPGALGLAACMQASAAIEFYDKDDTTVSIDASFNTFYTSTSTDNDISGNDRDQSRVKMGFLPNWVGFNFKKKVDDLTFGGRASFWVSINDSDESPTDGLIDTRQFYGTVDGAFGQVLFGKDFTLFNRSNVFNDEILLGYGWVNDTIGLTDGNNVSFGNIGSGYIYPLPTSQITYRTPTIGGFKLAIGIIDPSRTNGDDDAEEEAPRFEGELTYNTAWDDGTLAAWVGGLQQSSSGSTTSDVDSTGVSFGARVKIGGLALHASGYDGEGIGMLIGPADAQGLGLSNLVVENEDEIDSSGWLTQASYTMGTNRLALSFGQSEIDNAGDWENETRTVAWFHRINSTFTTAVEFTQNEFEIGGDTEEADTFGIGLIVNF